MQGASSPLVLPTPPLHSPLSPNPSPNPPVLISPVVLDLSDSPKESNGKKPQSTLTSSCPLEICPSPGWPCLGMGMGTAQGCSHGVSGTLGLVLFVPPAGGQEFLGTSRGVGEGQGWLTPRAPFQSLFSGGNCQDKIRSRLNFIYDLN